jgi:hypothetical protein
MSTLTVDLRAAIFEALAEVFATAADSKPPTRRPSVTPPPRPPGTIRPFVIRDDAGQVVDEGAVCGDESWPRDMVEANATRDHPGAHVEWLPTFKR